MPTNRIGDDRLGTCDNEECGARTINGRCQNKRCRSAQTGRYIGELWGELDRERGNGSLPDAPSRVDGRPLP